MITSEKGIFIRNIRQFKKAIRENKQFYLVYSNSNGELYKVHEIEEITEEMNIDSYIKVKYGNNQVTEVRYWEMTILK